MYDLWLYTRSRRDSCVASRQMAKLPAREVCAHMVPTRWKILIACEPPRCHACCST